MAGLNGRDGRDSRPVPDPTTKTDELVDKAIKGLREIIEARLTEIDKDMLQVQADIRTRPEAVATEIKHLEALHSEKIRGVSELVKSLQNAIHEVPDAITKEVERSEKVTDVRFKGVDTQFTERDTRIDQTATTAATAVNAALQAAKEAVREQNTANQLANTKAETGFSEQIKLLGTRIEDSKKSQEGSMNDVKDRLTRIESIAVGTQTQASVQRLDTTSDRAGNAFALSLVLAVVTVISVVFGIVMALR